MALSIAAMLGCSAPSTAPEVDEPPPPPDLAYEFELVEEPDLAVRISLTAHGAPDGLTTLSLDEGWGGVENVGQNVRDLAVSDARGEPLALEHPTGHEWRVHHPPNEELHVSYVLPANDRQSDADPRVHYAPILNPKLFHLIGNLGLVKPDHLAGDETRSIGFSWKGFDSAGWRVASSFGVAEEGVRVRASLDDFRQAVFVAGELRIYSKTIHGAPLSIAIAGREWGFDDGEFVMLAAEIVAEERAFFDDWEVQHYLISLIPVGRKEPGRTSLGGTGLTRSFATFMLPGVELKAGSREAMAVQHLLAHEMFHEWNGRLVRRAEPEQVLYWFSEGFTEFFARRILYRAGRLTTEQYAQDVDASLAGYMLSPVRNADGDRIREDFFKDRVVAELPYRRGDVVAMMLDRAIRERSQGARSLDDFMRDLVVRGRTGVRVDNEILMHDIELATDSEFAARVRRIVVEGETAQLDPRTFEPCLEMHTESLGPYELGFDFEASRKDGVVRGVREGTRAHAAGLREGQRLRACAVHGDRPEIPVKVEVSEGGRHLELTWLPQGEALPVPQFSLRKGAKQADCARL